MILLRTCILFAAVLLRHSIGFSQTEIQTYSQSVIKQIRAGSNDTIIVYEPFFYGMFFNEDTLAGIGPASVAGSRYILYKKAGKVFLVKCVQYDVKKAGDFTGFRLSRSQAVEVKNDTLYDWVRASLPELNNARLLPFICKHYNYTDSLPAYDAEGRLHDNSFSIDIYTATENFGSSAQQIDMQRTMFENSPSIDSAIHRVNMNYGYNSSTKLFRAIMGFKALVSKYDRYFMFKK